MDAPAGFLTTAALKNYLAAAETPDLRS